MNEKEKAVKTAPKAASSVKKKERELPFYVVKRGDAAKTFGRSLLIRGGAILIALLLCGIATIFVTGDNPLSIYATMFEGAFGNARNIWKTLQDMAILLCVSLAVTPAFKMRFWNTGAEGQVLISALATAMCMFYFGGSVPTPVLMLIMIAGSILAGVVWAVIPAIFKAFWGTNETLFTLMMNYVAIQLVEVFLKVADKSGSNTVGPSLLKHGWFPELFGQKYLLNILIVVVLTVLVYIYLKYSKQGYEISVVGESENTARYIGVNVKKVIIRTMIVSGALCGVAGLLLVAGTSHSIDSDLVGGRGFTAIMVSWLAKFDPLMMVLTTLLLVFLDRGASEVTTNFGLNAAYSEILTGVIIFFLIGSEFFINYKVMVNKNHGFFKKKAKKDVKEVL